MLHKEPRVNSRTDAAQAGFVRQAARVCRMLSAFQSRDVIGRPAGRSIDPRVGTASAPDAAADEQAVRAIKAWFTAYIAGDAEGVITQYSDGAVVNPPGAATVRAALTTPCPALGVPPEGARTVPRSA